MTCAVRLDLTACGFGGWVSESVSKMIPMCMLSLAKMWLDCRNRLAGSQTLHHRLEPFVGLQSFFPRGVSR
jgi:hypothetical protein